MVRRLSAAVKKTALTSNSQKSNSQKLPGKLGVGSWEWRVDGIFSHTLSGVAVFVSLLVPSPVRAQAWGAPAGSGSVTLLHQFVDHTEGTDTHAGRALTVGTSWRFERTPH
jgi:hypothetical protein